jgi:hypothetical protein
MEIHINIPCFAVCVLLFIFFISARKQLQRLLENNKLLYSVHYLLLTSHVQTIHHVYLQVNKFQL